MRRAVYIFCLAIMIGAASCAFVFGQDPIARLDGTDRSVREDILTLVNGERVKNDLAPVALDDALSAIAQNHARDMDAHGYFSHTQPGGVGMQEMLAAGGISYRRAGENIAWGYRSTRALVRGWMGSSGHRKNILGDFTKVGIGAYDGYYVLLLIKD